MIINSKDLALMETSSKTRLPERMRLDCERVYVRFCENYS